jgi:TRAP-type uncharacterized transport system substrate-binding protein
MKRCLEEVLGTSSFTTRRSDAHAAISAHCDRCAAAGRLPVAARAADLGVITGSEKGTYYQFGLNFQTLGKPNGINVTVVPSKGSIENIFAVYQKPGVQGGSTR